MKSPTKLRAEADAIERYRFQNRKWKLGGAIVTSREELGNLIRVGMYVAVCSKILHPGWAINIPAINSLIERGQVTRCIRNPSHPYIFEACLNRPDVSDDEWCVSCFELGYSGAVISTAQLVINCCRQVAKKRLFKVVFSSL